MYSVTRPRLLRLFLLLLAVLIGRNAGLSAQTDDSSDRVRIALIGDSTVASYIRPRKDRPDLTGWGQVFGEFFTDRIEVQNFALSGRSSKSFLRENRWQPVLDAKPDYVFIQFGHNDQPGKGDRTTDPEGDFRDNLRLYINDARKIGATPVLVTPVARRVFENGKPVTTLQPWADAMFAVGKETKTAVIDLHSASFRLYEKLGDAGSADFSPSTSDRTHFSRKGAGVMASLVASGIPKSVPQLKPLLKGD
jgi:lysophospholipase L1-like esterase